MNRCLITKLPSLVDNDELSRFNEFVIEGRTLPIDYFHINNTKSLLKGICTARIIGGDNGCFFRTKDTTNNLGTSIDIEAIDQIIFVNTNGTSCDICIQSYGTITQIGDATTLYTGGLGEIKFNVEQLIGIIPSNPLYLMLPQGTYGNLDVLADFGIKALDAYGTFSIGGSTSEDTITGSLASALSVFCDNTFFNNTADWGSFLTQSNVSGDLSTIPTHVAYFYSNKTNIPFTWTIGNRASGSILCNMHLLFASQTDLDNMFIDQSSCDFIPVPNSHGGNNVKIQVYVEGIYTPSIAAQTAINSLYTKGLQGIKVNDIEMDAYRPE